MAIATGQFTIYDLNDIIIQPTEPSPAQEGMVWLDTSGQPPYQFKTYKGGKWERTTHNSLEELDPEQYTIITESYQAIKDLDMDNKLTRYERSVVRGELAVIIGKHLSSSEDMPTLSEIDSGGVGDLYAARREAREVGIPTNDTTYVRLENAYNSLKTYLSGLTPKAWDIDSPETVDIDSESWDGVWDEYYVALTNLRVLTAVEREKNRSEIEDNINTIEQEIIEISDRVEDAEIKLQPDNITATVTAHTTFTRIIQEVEEGAQEYVEQYAEKRRHTGPTPPADKSVIWVDNSNPDSVVWKVYDPAQGIWVVGPSGPQGPKGEKGDKGDPGRSVVSIVEEYYHSTSPTQLVGGSWSTTVPSWVNGKYVWTRAKTTFSDGTTQTTDPINVTGSKGDNGQTYYTWVKYADTATGEGMSDSPDGKRYLGIAVNKTSPNESSNPADYTWTPLYDNVQVGGRNLLRNTSNPSGGDYLVNGENSYSEIYTDPEKGNVFESTTTSTEASFIYTSRTEPINPDTEYTFSCGIWVNDNVSSVDLFWLSDTASDPATGSGYRNVTSKPNIPIQRNVWHRITWTFKTKPDDYTGFIRIGNNGSKTSDAAATIRVTNLQLEEGNIPTTYREAPEDAQDRLDNVANDIGEQINTVSEQTAQIQQKVDEITSSVESIETTMTNTATEIEELRSEVNQTTTSLSVEFEEIRENINEHGSTLEDVRSNFTFSADGLAIGKSDNPLNIVISNEQMDFKDGGKVIAYINGQKMYIDSLEVLNSIVLGNHKIEKYNDDITLIKWVGG